MPMNSPTRLALWRSPGLTSRVIQFFKREQNRMPDAEFFGEAGPQRHSGILPKLPANWPILSDGRRLLGDKTDISLSVRFCCDLTQLRHQQPHFAATQDAVLW